MLYPTISLDGAVQRSEIELNVVAVTATAVGGLGVCPATCDGAKNSTALTSFSRID